MQTLNSVGCSILHLGTGTHRPFVPMRTSSTPFRTRTSTNINIKSSLLVKTHNYPVSHLEPEPKPRANSTSQPLPSPKSHERPRAPASPHALQILVPFSLTNGHIFQPSHIHHTQSVMRGRSPPNQDLIQATTRKSQHHLLGPRASLTNLIATQLRLSNQ